MGEAKRRGNFEERKEQAVKAGRVKGASTLRKKISNGFNSFRNLLDPALLAALIRAKARGRKKARRVAI